MGDGPGNRGDEPPESEPAEKRSPRAKESERGDENIDSADDLEDLRGGGFGKWKSEEFSGAADQEVDETGVEAESFDSVDEENGGDSETENPEGEIRAECLG